MGTSLKFFLLKINKSLRMQRILLVLVDSTSVLTLRRSISAVAEWPLMPAGDGHIDQLGPDGALILS